MSDTKILAGLHDAVAVEAGEQPAERIHVNGVAYVPEARALAAEAECLEEARIVGAGTERILDLMAQVERVTRERDRALARVEKLTSAVHGAVIAAATEAAAHD